MDVEDRFINQGANLPYGVSVDDVVAAIENTYEYYIGVDEWHSSNGYGSLSNYLRANNGRSDFIGNVVTNELSDVSNPIIHNEQEDGFPDLLPVDDYTSYNIQRGDSGIETKCSKNASGWYAHSNVSSWVIVFRYELTGGTPPIDFVQVVAADLDVDDWSHQPRKDGSRRTATSSINKHGMHKLRSNPIIQKPAAITGRGDKRRTYEEIQASFDGEFDRNL